MAKTLEQILGSVNLTGLIQSQKSGIPDPLPDGFASVQHRVLGADGRYTQVQGTRKTARLAAYGSPARRRELKGIDEKDVKLLHTKESQILDVMTFQRLRNYTDYGVQSLGMQEVARQASVFRQIFANLRIAIRLQMLANGVLYYDASGNLLPSSSGAKVTVSAQMAAGNQGQLNVFGTGAIIASSWATATTNIPLHLRNLDIAAAKSTGFPLRGGLAFYGVNIPTYFQLNDYLNDWWVRNPAKNESFLNTNEIPSGFLGRTWVPVYESFYEDADGTNQEIFGGDSIIFTPPVSPEWWQGLEGSYPVPTSINLDANTYQMNGAFRIEYGGFGYSVPAHDPPTYESYYGDTMLWIPTVPNAIFQADVTP